MFIIFFVPAIVLIMGFIMYLSIPSKINRLYGYRTRMSMKSQAAWDYSQKLSAIISLYSGIIMLVIAAILFIFVLRKLTDYLSACVFVVVIQIVILTLSYIPVEVALRKRFDKYGNSK